jgi:hypothetical protein
MRLYVDYVKDKRIVRVITALASVSKGPGGISLVYLVENIVPYRIFGTI